MKKFGLIGYPLSHSFSKKYFENKFEQENIKDCSYENYQISELPSLKQIIEKGLIGINVTIPYKEEVINYLNDIDEVAKEIGAVNTIKIDTSTNTTKGYNTDYYGFQKSLKPFLKNIHERALILGTGGASKAVQYALSQLGIDCLFVSRNPKSKNEISYEDVNEYVMKFHLLIINTTPVGTFPEIDIAPGLPYQYLTNKHLLYDLVYNPDETLFLKKGKEKGCITINGLEMLKLQAEEAWRIWNS